jgi:hypothetical protein
VIWLDSFEKGFSRLWFSSFSGCCGWWAVAEINVADSDVIAGCGPAYGRKNISYNISTYNNNKNLSLTFFFKFLVITLSCSYNPDSANPLSESVLDLTEFA